MQKIIIDNFGPIQHVEIEVKKVLVLIGEQATGKSTIAKLIYFFYDLKDKIYEEMLFSLSKENSFEKHDVIRFIENTFQESFSSQIKNNPRIRFYYNEEESKFIEIFIEKKHLKTKISGNIFDKAFFTEVEKTIEGVAELKKQKGVFNKFINFFKEGALTWDIRDKYNNFFDIAKKENLFIVAGRSATVSYSELYEKQLFSQLQKRIENHTHSIIDDILLMKFIYRVIELKENHRKIENTTKIKVVSEPDNGYSNKKIGIKDYFITKAATILKGEYHFENEQERIVDKINNVKTYLNEASSGQQEVVRILQDMENVISEKTKVLRVIEEPEAHLFPTAQKNLIELFALMVNQSTENQLIITTHSPYILTALNNLLFAKRVINKNPSVEEIVNQQFPSAIQLEADSFAAYSLGNGINENEVYCENIFNPKTGMIKQNYLDTVSDILGNNFNFLYQLYNKPVGK